MVTDASKKTAKVLSIRQDKAEYGQMPLLPLRVEAEISSNFETADLKKLVMTHDRHYYAVKLLSDHPFLPASEFLCYKLAVVCNLSVPFSSLIEMQNGEIAFGSRFEGGLSEWDAIGPAQQFHTFQNSSQLLSGILAFDLFVGNEDRHNNNFVWRKNHKGEWIPFAIDYSRALFVRGFPDDVFPLPESSHTRTTISALKKAGAWQGPYALFTLQNLQNVRKGNLQHWFDEMPSNWLPNEERKHLMEWWDSPAFRNRLNALFSLL